MQNICSNSLRLASQFSRVGMVARAQTNVWSRRTLVQSARSLQKEDQQGLQERHIPSAMDKKMLVYARMYPHVDEVPETVSYTKMKKARDQMRIRTNIGMILATLVGCGMMIYWGRRMRDSGESLQKWGAQWEQDMKEQGRKEREEAAAEAAQEADEKK